MIKTVGACDDFEPRYDCRHISKYYDGLCMVAPIIRLRPVLSADWSLGIEKKKTYLTCRARMARFPICPFWEAKQQLRIKWGA